jgi:hypothetical protein
MSKKRKATGIRPREPRVRSNAPKTLKEAVDAFNAEFDPHDLRPQLKPGETRIIGSGTGFNTPGKKAPEKPSPELEELSKDLGLTVQDIVLLSEIFPPKNP